MNKIVERIVRATGVPNLVSILAEQLTPTDLQSLLLEVYRIRSSRIQPSELLASFESNRFARPSVITPLSLLHWEQIALSQLPPEFIAIELSPVCPVGTNSVIAKVDQNWSVTSIRNLEVVSDSTNVLALECAVRRREILRNNPKSSDQVHLAASHRLLRAQNYNDSNLIPHFGTFVLCSAGRGQSNLSFELSTLRLHIDFYLKALRMFLGLDIPLRLAITDLNDSSRNELIKTQLFSAVQARFENVECVFDEQRTKGRGYYLELCFHIYALTPDHTPLELVDGGAVNWTQKLLSNAKERLVISGIGSERLCKEFGEAAAGAGRETV